MSKIENPGVDPDFRNIKCPLKRGDDEHIIVGVQHFENNVPDAKQANVKKLRNIRCMGYEVRDRKGTLVVLNCSRSEHEKKHQVKCSENTTKQYTSHVSYVCNDQKCRAAFCRHCIDHLIKYGPNISRADEVYKIWLKKNKARKLYMLEDQDEEYNIPDYGPKGMSYD